MDDKQEIWWDDILKKKANRHIHPITCHVYSAEDYERISSFTISILHVCVVLPGYLGSILKGKKKNASCHIPIQFFPPFVLLGSGAGDLLPDRVWTLLLLLQAVVAGTIHTGR